MSQTELKIPELLCCRKKKKINYSVFSRLNFYKTRNRIRGLENSAFFFFFLSAILYFCVFKIGDIKIRGFLNSPTSYYGIFEFRGVKIPGFILSILKLLHLQYFKSPDFNIADFKNPEL